MTRLLSFGILITLAAGSQLTGQESPSPSPSAEESPTATATATPATATSGSATVRNIPLRFVPPPLEGTISLGIWDSNDKLVRVLQREAKIDTFTVEENSLSTTWDGKSDTGEDLAAGKYRARGFLVGKLKIEDLGKAASSPPTAADRISLKLVTNPLNSDTRAIMEVAVAFDPSGSFLKTTDGLPLATLSRTPNLIRVAIEKN